MVNWDIKTIVKPQATNDSMWNKYEAGKQRSPQARRTCQMCHPIAPEHCTKFTTTLLALNLNINPIPVTKLHEYLRRISVTECEVQVV